jgi:LysM repeat protein
VREAPVPVIAPAAAKVVAGFEQVVAKAADAEDSEEYEAEGVPLDELLKAGAAGEKAAVSCPVPGAKEDDDDGEMVVATGDDGEDDEAEGEEHNGGSVNPSGLLYSADLSDADLEKLWKENRKSLGTLSVGFTDAGRVLNSEPFPCDGPWTVVTPANAWGTTETIEYLKAAFENVNRQFPDAYTRLNHISKREGGYLRPHRSHQSGRDVDLGFFYRGGGVPGPKMKKRETIMDLARNWALVKSVVTLTDVQMILVDHRVQAVLYEYALSIGEDREWLDSLFHAGANSLIKHARSHRDHFHVRFYNPRAQELGRRVQPLMAKSGELQQVVYHRIKRGDVLGRIAKKYGVTVSALRKVNGAGAKVLRVGRSLVIPMRGPCTNCPVPPPVVVPPRRLPPEHREAPTLSLSGEAKRNSHTN